MAITGQTLDKVSQIVMAELPKRLPASVRIHVVHAQTLQAGDDDFVHIIVVYEGDRQQLDARILNEFDDEIEPLLMEIGIHPVPPISYVNANEPGQWSELRSVPPQDGQPV